MSVRSAKIDQKADLIWAIADKLTGVYKPDLIVFFMIKKMKFGRNMRK